jgi:hypothetical protein
MTTKKETNQTTDLQVNTVLGLQTNYKKLAENHLTERFANNPEFKAEFIKTFSDLIFSQNDEMLEKLAKTRQNTLLNAIFKATEAGASFAKKEVSLIPYEIFKKTTEKGVEKKVATGEFDAIVIFDINFEKQQILKLPNCKRFFTAEVHEGVKVTENLMTGTTDFEGENDITKPTIGYYACFITTEGEKYDKFMTLAQIVERASFSPQFKSSNYKQTSNNVHYEKLVVRNLMKEIPKISNELKSILAVDEIQYHDYIEVEEPVQKIEEKKVNQLEQAKKEIAEKEPAKKAEKVDTDTGEITDIEEYF